MIGLKTKISLSQYSKQSAFLFKNTHKQFGAKSQNTYPFLVIKNTPTYWNESLIKARLEDIGEIESVQRINTSLNTLYRNNQSVYSGETEKSMKDDKDLNTFIVKLKSLKKNQLISSVTDIIKEHKDMKFEVTKDLNIKSFNVTQPQSYTNLLLVFSKNTDKKLSELDYLQKFIKNNSEIKTKKSVYDNYMYIWCESTKAKESLNKLIEQNGNDLYACNSKAHYTKLPSSNVSSITYKSSSDNDLRLLRELNNKLEVLRCVKVKNSGEIERDINQKINTLKNVIREKESLAFIKPYSIIGSSGVVLYDL